MIYTVKRVFDGKEWSLTQNSRHVTRTHLKNETIAILNGAKDLSKPQNFFQKNVQRSPVVRFRVWESRKAESQKTGGAVHIKNLSANLILFSDSSV